MTLIPYTKPLQRATLLKRYKRFLADVQLADGTVTTVHCANSGRMTSCCKPGQAIWISDSQNSKRKLLYTWEMIKMEKHWVGVHSAYANHLVATWILAGAISELKGYPDLKREVIYGIEGRSRVDMVLSNHDDLAKCYVEVKHCSMRVGDDAAFPDAISIRAKKHLKDLIYVKENGNRAVIFFLIARNDCLRFRPASEIDPDYALTLRHAANAGVEILPYASKFGPNGVSLLQRIPIDL